MSESQDQKREDEVLLRMLKTPPKPRAEMKVKKKPSRAKSATGNARNPV